MVKAPARAFRVAEDAGQGAHATIDALAPEIVEAILDGRQPAGRQLDDLLAGVPLKWEGQHRQRLFGSPRNRNKANSAAYFVQRCKIR